MNLIERRYLEGEREKTYTPCHTGSVDWTAAGTDVLLEPPIGENWLVTRLGFTAYNTVADFTQTIKMEKYEGSNWITVLEADCFAKLMCVATRVDKFTLAGVDVVAILWHFRNGIEIVGSAGEKLKIYPSANITGSTKFYSCLRYFKYPKSR